MNIDSANIVNVLPGSTAIEGLTTLLPVEGAVTEGFADALKMQLQFLTDASTGTISPINTETPPLSAEQLSVEVQKTADLLGNDLPVSYKVDDKDDVDATLSVVTDSLKYLEAGAVAQPETPQVPLPVIADQPQLQAETEQQSKDDDTAQLAVVDDQEAQALLAQRMMVLTQNQPQLQAPESEASAASQAEALSLLKSSSEIAKINADKQLNQIKTEQVQLKTSVTSESFSADLAQQEQNAATGKLAQTGKLTAVTGKSGQTEQLAEVTSKIEANVVGAASVNGQVDKIPAEVKTEVPALTRPLSHPEWNKDLGERIVWMNNRALPAAEINLNPQHLGPVSVRIDMNQDQASIVFTAQHAAVREAIEASLPKLREMLGEQQLNLVNVSIAQHGSSEQKQAQAQPQYANQTNGEVAADGGDGNSAVEGERVVVSNGLLNTYA
ncbi:MAG: flagellar hook-length control protein FliK [Methylococcaceae bacterium]|nr:flagellar hook-length control protein FliK [Methylococcaceae bacterium]